MKIGGKENVRRARVLLGAALLAAGGGGALLGGCKGNTTAAAMVERHAGVPPVVQVVAAAGVMADEDPLTSTGWKGARWWGLGVPLNSARTTPPSRAAVRYCGDTLYVAAICEVGDNANGSRDAVVLYLDTTGEGRELMQIVTDAGGMTYSTWIRTAAKVMPLEDGGPNMGYPLDMRPDVKVDGLKVKVGQGVMEGRAVWTAVLAVPVAGLPGPMQVLPGGGGGAAEGAGGGKSWKFNVLRVMTGAGGEPLQANLSAVYVNAQAFSPQRMAELDVKY